MSHLELAHGDLVAHLDRTRWRLELSQGGRRLPWVFDLGGAQMLVRHGHAEPLWVPLRLDDLTEQPLGPSRLQWIGEVQGAPLALEVGVERGDLVFAVSASAAGGPEVIGARWPGDVGFTAPQREVCWSCHNQGSLFRSDGHPWQGSQPGDHSAMRVHGFSTGAETLAAIVETPLDAVVTFADDGAATARATVEFRPSLGVLGSPRSIRYRPVPPDGHVAIAQAFRGYARANGLWRSWADRVAENPRLADLPGAFVAGAGYFRDDGADLIGAMSAMRAYGFERGYLFSPTMLQFAGHLERFAPTNRLLPGQLGALSDLGYVAAPFLQVEEVDDTLPAELLAEDEHGEPIKRWQINETIFHEIAKWRVPGLLPRLESLLHDVPAVHFDTLTAMSLMEHWGRRPYDRAGDVAWRCAIAQHYRRQGKMIGSESMRDWGNAIQDLATGKTFTPFAAPDRRVRMVPLTDLVYHDSLIRTHWEHWAYDDVRCVRSTWMRDWHPFAMELMDLLTCSPPVLFPEGMLYEFALVQREDADGDRYDGIDWSHATLYRKRFTDPETQAVLPAALRVCQLHARHGTSRMLRHRFLDDSGLVQDSEFASGLHVMVNFADEPFSLPDGRHLPARGSLVEA